MLVRLLTTIVLLAVLGAVLLALRQHPLQMMHAMADLHVQMDTDRKDTWDAQAHIAEHIHPVALREAVERVGLRLEPLPSDTTADDAPRDQAEDAPSMLPTIERAPRPVLPPVDAVADREQP